MKRRYLQLDVFADVPGAGNPLAVVVDAEGMETAAMQAFAHWTGLSETAFLLPPAPGADYRVRIFTPHQELPFAGHPSVGAAFAAVSVGAAQPRDGTLVQECAGGLLPVRIGTPTDPARISVRAPRALRLEQAAADDAALTAALAGIPRGELSPALWSNGPQWWLAELADAQAVRRMQPDLAAIAALTRSSELGLAVFAHEATDTHDLVVRAFCPTDGIPEDPVTGSANAAIAAALSHAGRLPRGERHYTASQGREVGRDGRVAVQVDDEGEVWIGGRVQTVIRGEVCW